jgi:L-serine/L-threonine ammonia-lyase
LVAHLSKASDREKIHFYSSSGGNAGLACVCAAVSLGVPATIVVPMSTTPYMMSKIRAAGAAEVIQMGTSWAEADAHLREVVVPEASAKGQTPVYVPPFDAQDIWDGHATMVGEMLEQFGPGQGPPDAVVCSVGGGGLFCGLMQGLNAAGLATTKVVAVETEGAHALALSLEQGCLSTLPSITSIATTLGARRVAAQAFEYGKRDSVTSVVLSDAAAMEGCVRFAEDERIMVEAACGVSLALCYQDRMKKHVQGLTEDSKVVIVVCGGANISVQMLSEWAHQIQ